MSAKLWPPSPFLTDKKKIYFFRVFFIHIPIEPECSEMDNFYMKKLVVVDLPDFCIQNMISMVVLTTKAQIYIPEKCFKQKELFGHAEFTVCLKSRFW